jgi:type I protein arginine methyltransferase
LSYDFVNDHIRMLKDEVRTNAYLAAINRVVRPGMAVLDFGTGSGVLACFAARAGARRVYAVDRSPFIRAARAVAKHNGLDNITFLATDGGEFELPEKVDVLVSECMGHYVFDERMVADMLEVRAKHLLPSGVVIPSALVLKAALVGAPHLDEAIEYFDVERYGIDFAPLATIAHSQRRTVAIPPTSLLGPIGNMGAVDMLLDTAEPTSTKAAVQLDVAARAYGIGAWFDAELAADIVLRTGPTDPQSHWQQSFFPFLEPCDLGPGPVELRIDPVVAEKRTFWRWGAKSSTVVVQGDDLVRLHFRRPLPLRSPGQS